MSYMHAGGIDRPLVITKGGESVLPHQNWRGQFSRGTYANGASSDCVPGQTYHCAKIAWPGWRTTAWHVDAKDPDIRTWWGGLVDGMRDVSGQMYMRNRYYDPATGQFTQQDPIGIAGGLNTYGFAAGDPVSYSDPYGLCAEDDAQQDSTRALKKEEDRRLRCIANTRMEEGARAAFLGDLDQGLVRVGLGQEASAWGSVPWGASPPIIFAEGVIMRQSEVHVALTAAHEVRHKGQRAWPFVQKALRNGYYELIRDSMEADAEAYAFRVVDRTLSEYCEP